MEKNKSNLPAVRESRELDIKNTAFLSLSPATREAYQNDFDNFFGFVNKNPDKITASDILGFVKHLEDNDYKNATINRKIAALSKMFKVMVIAGEIKVNPVEALKQFRKITLKTSKEVKISLTLADIRKTIKTNKKSTIYQIRTAMIIKTLAMTGLRISEFINIKNKDVSDFDEKNKIIRILGKGKKERSIFLSKDHYSDVKKYYPDTVETDYLFYTKLHTPYDRRVLHEVIRKTFDEKIGKDVHPHLLRHFYATYKINVEKQDIKAVSLALGHSDVSTSLNFYVNTSLDSKSYGIKI